MADELTLGRFPLPCKEGTRVRYSRRVRGQWAEDGIGVFTLCWLGIEEAWNVRRDDGSTVTLYPCFGDSMEAVV